MPRGDKSAYTNKQKRQAEHIEEGYEKKGVSHKKAEARAWATVNASDGGGKKSGSGRGKATNTAPARKGARKAAAARKKTAKKKAVRKSPARKTTARKTAKRKSPTRKRASR